MAHHDRIKKLAAAAGKSMGDYCAEILAQAHGWDMPRRTEQQDPALFSSSNIPHTKAG